MPNAVTLIGVALAGYLLGSFPAGYLLCRLRGVNVLERGSGRTGGTNVFRAVGILPALLTGALDVGKGALAVWLAGRLMPGDGQAMAQVLAGAAVILGHNHSIFLGFRGGAGVGTSLGALGAVYWPAAVALAVLLVVLIAVTRYASIGSLAVVTAMPIVLIVLASTGILAGTYVFYGLLAWALIVYAHRPNIRRLLAGTERRLGDKRPTPS
jgi:acyl phosphate:glycerol-3-phosphate acyltransferase